MLGAGLMAASLLLCAQSVYVTRGANGPVFSDKPQPGAREMQLKPINVVPAQKGAQEKTADAGQKHLQESRGRQASPEDAAPPYRTLTILFPEQNGSVVANTGSFNVRLAVEPPLRLGEGHAFVISLNGQPVGQRFTATDFMFPPEFWGGYAPPVNQRAQLDVSIVDSAGRVIMNAPPAVFLMRYTTVLQRPHALPPPQPLYPPPPPPHPWDAPPRHPHPAPPAPSTPTYIPPWKPAYPKPLHPGSREVEMPPGTQPPARRQLDSWSK